jgi:hypothetical protein
MIAMGCTDNATARIMLLRTMSKRRGNIRIPVGRRSRHICMSCCICCHWVLEKFSFMKTGNKSVFLCVVKIYIYRTIIRWVDGQGTVGWSCVINVILLVS